MALKKISPLSVNKVVEQAAEYLRDDGLYLHLSNSTDAKDWLVENLGKNIKDIINLGYSYEQAGNYIVACDVTKLQKENPQLFEDTFSMYRYTIKQIEREKKDVMFICLIVPKKQYMDNSTIKALKEFLKTYSKNYVILTDGIHEKDINTLKKSINSSELSIDGMHIFRWG